MRDLVIAMTGASGAAYCLRLLEVLVAAGRTVHLTISPAATQVLRHELDLQVDLNAFDPQQLLPADGQVSSDSKLKLLKPDGGGGYAASSIFSDSEVFTGKIVYHHYRDYSSGIASGSFLTGGMVICPCSMGTLASIATGQSQNLIHRAADVHLKERRKLVVVPRETPLSVIALDNMKRLAEAGATILPAMPGFYHSPKSIHDLIDFVVARICDQLGVQNELIQRWGADSSRG
ncbi:MAG: UbiX family flavin prenyltransferase [Planctomycetes bacterium]|nr:UbiX family flavin prenyltransferase [Planctomycetota bacterium]